MAAMSAHLSRSARGEINRLPCVFALALNQRCAVCSLAQQDADQLLCTQPLARAACAGLHGLLREKSRFALGQRSARPSAVEETRLQCGGLAGLHEALDRDTVAIDVQRLLERIAEGGMDSLDWMAVLRAIGQAPRSGPES